jgi:hypothetical protein
VKRFITSFAVALGCTAVAISAQETKTRTETRSSGGEAQVVTYTGCVQAGTEAKTYMLNKVVPVTKTTTTETPTSTTTTSSTSFVLVAGETDQVQESVGKKVEVTGTLIPAGNIRSETTTRTGRTGHEDARPC